MKGLLCILLFATIVIAADPSAQVWTFDLSENVNIADKLATVTSIVDNYTQASSYPPREFRVNMDATSFCQDNANWDYQTGIDLGSLNSDEGLYCAKSNFQLTNILSNINPSGTFMSSWMRVNTDLREYGAGCAFLGVGDAVQPYDVREAYIYGADVSVEYTRLYYNDTADIHSFEFHLVDYTPAFDVRIVNETVQIITSNSEKYLNFFIGFMIGRFGFAGNHTYAYYDFVQDNWAGDLYADAGPVKYAVPFNFGPKSESSKQTTDYACDGVAVVDFRLTETDSGAVSSTDYPVVKQYIEQVRLDGPPDNAYIVKTPPSLLSTYLHGEPFEFKLNGTKYPAEADIKFITVPSCGVLKNSTSAVISASDVVVNGDALTFETDGGVCSGSFNVVACNTGDHSECGSYQRTIQVEVVDDMTDFVAPSVKENELVCLCGAYGTVLKDTLGLDQLTIEVLNGDIYVTNTGSLDSIDGNNQEGGYLGLFSTSAASINDSLNTLYYKPFTGVASETITIRAYKSGKLISSVNDTFPITDVRSLKVVAENKVTTVGVPVGLNATVKLSDSTMPEDSRNIRLVFSVRTGLLQFDFAPFMIEGCASLSCECGHIEGNISNVNEMINNASYLAQESGDFNVKFFITDMDYGYDLVIGGFNISVSEVVVSSSSQSSVSSGGSISSSSSFSSSTASTSGSSASSASTCSSCSASGSTCPECSSCSACESCSSCGQCSSCEDCSTCSCSGAAQVGIKSILVAAIFLTLLL